MRRIPVSANNRTVSFSLAEKCGFLAIFSAALLFFISPYFAVIPLLLFLLLCTTAPFLPTLSFFLPLISKAKKCENGIAITFDDGPDPVSTPIILKLLARYNLQATFFVVGIRAARYPELIKEILRQGHTIGNHSWDHDYFLMLRSIKRLQEDIHKTQNALIQSGIQPRLFRPPVGITGSRLGKVLEKENLIAVTYSCRALDRGNRNIDDLAAKILGKLQPGDIIMLHDLPLATKEQAVRWQKELDSLFATLEKQYTITSLAKLIGEPTMIPVDH